MPRTQHDWENPEIFQTNTLAPRATAVYFPDTASALAGGDSPWQYSLNGEWEFHWCSTPNDVPERFQEPGYTGDWETIPVPSNWEMHGYGRPAYVNIGPRDGLNKKKIPTIDHGKNEIGCYRHTFTLPPEWDGMQVLLHFDGVRSAFNLWINGEQMGYSQGSNTPVEFEITNFLQPGENLIAVQVFSLCDGTYLEDQDMWRLSGIFRDVLLIAKPPTHIWDFYLKSELDADYQDAKLEALVVARSKGQTPQVELTLVDAEGVPVSAPLKLEHTQHDPAEWLFRLEGNLTVNTPCKWSAEDPYLYTVLLELKDQTGNVLEATALPFGFRVIEIKNKQILVNGQPVIMKGANRHETDPIVGQMTSYDTESKARMEKDVRLLKQYNFNAVRTSHYPNHPYFYHLCNRYGLYVMDEANLETHGTAAKIPGKKLEWRTAMVNRMVRMVARDRNHPSIVFWSLGNEAESGENFAHMRRAAEALDSSRPFHYEGDHKLEVSDVVSTMYPPPWRLEQIAKAEKTLRFSGAADFLLGTPVKPEIYGKAPILICEFVHAMGNSISYLDEHMRIFEKYPHAAGGYIWDFVDQTLLKKTKDGRTFWAYGGDFGDQPNDGPFCVNGVFDAKRLPHPHAYEVKKVFQCISLEAVDVVNGKVKVNNKHWFTDLSSYQILWELLENGEVIEQGDLPPLNTPPGASEEIHIPFKAPSPKPGAEYHLTVHFCLASDTNWAEKGYEIAWEQIVVPFAVPPQIPPNLSELLGLDVIFDDENIILAGDGFSVSFNPENGALTAYRMGGENLLTGPLTPNFWRAPTDNDLMIYMFFPFLGDRMSRRKYWREAAGKRELIDFQLEQMSDGSSRIFTSCKIPYGKTPLRLNYIVRPDGEVEVAYSFTPRRELIRAGMTLQMHRKFDTLSWFGLGPHETMPDRKASGAVGVYSGKVEELIHDYVNPQENGNRSEVRWASLTDAGGKGLLIKAVEPLLNVSAWPYTQEDLEQAKHIHELPRRDQITLNIDYAQRPVGDLYSYRYGWGDKVLKAGMECAYRFVLKGVKAINWRLGKPGNI
jgi:beta-galactosidase